MHQVVVRQLVVSLTSLNHGRGVGVHFLAFGVGGREEANFAIEDAEQVVEVLRAAGVARRRQQLGVGAQVALDVGARFGQQRLQNDAGGLLVVAVLGRGAGGAE